MAQAKNYDMAVYPTAGLVRSQSDGARAHQVTLSSCDCADYINRKGQLVETEAGPAVTVCKHVAEFLERVGGWNRPVPGPAAPPPGRRAAEPLVHQAVTRERARAILAGAGVEDARARSVLTSIRGQHGRDTLRLPEGGWLLVTYDAQIDRYDVRFPAVSGLSRPSAYETLGDVGVAEREARRALREAMSTGSAYAGLPDGHVIAVKHEGGVEDGLFTLTFPA
jgi:hypothetical protein